MPLQSPLVQFDILQRRFEACEESSIKPAPAIYLAKITQPMGARLLGRGPMKHQHRSDPIARSLRQASARSLSFFAKQNRNKSSPLPGLKNADPATEATPVFASSVLAFSAAVAPGRFSA